jgi:hypothetical protein
VLFGLFNLPLCLIGVVYLNSLEIGWTPTWVGFIVLASYIPIWLYTQRRSKTPISSLPYAPASERGAEDLDMLPS